MICRQNRVLAPHRAPNGAGRVPVGEPELPELVVWHELLDQRKELSLLKPDVCVKQFSRRIQRLSIDGAGRHGDFEFASEPLELHVLDACLAEGSRLHRKGFALVQITHRAGCRRCPLQRCGRIVPAHGVCKFDRPCKRGDFDSAG